MKEFLVLFKRELKMQFPFRSRKGQHDVLGGLLTGLITLIISGVFIFLFTEIVKSYVAVKLNKVYEPAKRGLELLNACYILGVIASTIACLEKMRRTLSQKKDKELLLRLPVSVKAILLSKLATTALWLYACTLLWIIPVNVIFYIVLKPTAVFWLYSFLVWLFIPTLAILMASIILLPYIKIVDFISNKYTMLFTIYVAFLAVVFVAYSGFLDILKSLLQTGSIKFMFNEAFVTFLQKTLAWAYPTNCYANLIFGKDLFLSLTIILLIAALTLLIVNLVAKRLFFTTMYKTEKNRTKVRRELKFRANAPLKSLIKKEFITIFREPRHIFSYFAISAAMPIMAYCCYTLFESLIKNALGINVSFAIGVLVMLVFSVLTNTFCASNLSRDGITIFQAKTFPIKAKTILLAKVIFCVIVSTLTIIMAMLTLGLGTSLTALESVICAISCFAFSAAQIFLATRVDLNRVHPTASPAETERLQSRTITKIVTLGVMFALIMGVAVLFLSIFGQRTATDALPFYVYLIPLCGSLIYFVGALFYYTINIEKQFYKIVA